MTLERLRVLLALMCKTSNSCEFCPLNVYEKHCSYDVVLSVVSKLEAFDKEFSDRS